MIHVVIAEPHAILRQRICRLCSDTHDVAVAAETSAPEELLREAHRTAPNAIVMSLVMTAGFDFALLRELKGQFPTVPVIILSLYRDDLYAMRAMESGASGFLMMEGVKDQLIETVRMFVLGGPLAVGPAHFAAI
jgi:DNA-binding NarL/FixJ family response regulator